MDTWPRVAVIILNWNNYPDTKECLESLKKIDYPDYEILLIDNGSTDGSILKLKNEFPECTFILLEKNEGFAVGNNKGFQRAIEHRFKYVLTLNNDTTVELDFLTVLIQASEKEPQTGIFAPKLLNYEDRQIIDSAGHFFRRGGLVERGHGQRDQGQFDNKTIVIGACAAGALYRVKMLEHIGLFDESFVTQYEDAELSWRAHSQGWRARFVPEAIIYHKRGSTKKRDKELMYQLETVNTLKNITTTVKKYGNLLQKLLYLLYLSKNWLTSLCRRRDKSTSRFYGGLILVFLSRSNKKQISAPEK